MIVGRGDAGQRSANHGPVALRQIGVEGRALAVPGDKDGNVVLMEARMSGRSAASTRLARQIGPPALERLEDEGFIGFDDSAQGSRLVVGGRRGETLPPTEVRRRRDSAQ